ncbi:hypothetical protein ACFVTX_18255 [Agromyces sp. NPDC058136]|uniref:hypothetical protein n=1 Tax=Agromyces sp. NPDC058136 TaxID=3346354 RepID=UPI0036DF9125
MQLAFAFPPALVLGLIVSTILPLLVGLVTNTVTSPGRRATLLAALAAVTGLLTELLAAVEAGVTYDLGTGLVIALGMFLVAVGMHFGIWKPTGVSATLQQVGMKDAGTASTTPNDVTALPPGEQLARAYGDRLQLTPEQINADLTHRRR